MASIADLQASLLPPEKAALKFEGLKNAPTPEGCDPHTGFRYYVIDGKQAAALDLRNIGGPSYTINVYGKNCVLGAGFDFTDKGVLEDSTINRYKIDDPSAKLLAEMLAKLRPMHEVSRTAFDSALARMRPAELDPAGLR